MNYRLKQFLTVILAVSLMTSPALAAGAGGSGSGPIAMGLFSGFGVDAPDDVVEYDTPGGAQPGVIVEVQSSEDLDALQKWANSSDERKVIERYNASNSALLAIPSEDIKPSLLNSLNPTESRTTLNDLSYVTGWNWDQKVSNVKPATVYPEDEFEEPPGSKWAEISTSGDYKPGMAAWDADAPNSNLTHARTLVGADAVSANGTGVDIAVIDSGVNIGNGSLYGDGTAGSDMRVTDAKDYVGGEEPNLSTDRGNLSSELAKVADPNGHGSWVSSATLNAETGVAPDANLMAYRTLNADGEGSTSDIKSAIARADRNGADILVMSLGSPKYSEAMADELKRALEDGNVTAAFVAVGNSYPMRVSSPADVDAVIGVTATNAVSAEDAKRAHFANSGPDNGMDGSGGQTHGVTPDTAAPGMEISAPVWSAPKADGGYQTTDRLSGTSMAAPIAGGVGALLLEAEPGLEGNTTGFNDRIINSGAHSPHIGTTESEGGMVNATRAINQPYNSTTAAPERDLTTDTEGRDAANTALAGDVGRKLTALSDWGSAVEKVM